MTTTQHTPGPWYVLKYGNHGVAITDAESNKEICEKNEHLGLEDEDYANFKILASAPDLLAALTELTAWVEELVPTNRPPTDTRVSLLNKSKAAIAKAEGEAHADNQ